MRAALREGRVESVVEPVFVCDLGVTPTNVTNCRQNKLRREGERSQHCRRIYRPVVRSMRHPARDIAAKAAIMAIDPQCPGSGTIARRETPTILAVTFKCMRVAQGVLLLDMGCAPAVLEVIASLLAHEAILEILQLEPGL